MDRVQSNDINAKLICDSELALPSLHPIWGKFQAPCNPEWMSDRKEYQLAHIIRQLLAICWAIYIYKNSKSNKMKGETPFNYVMNVDNV